MILRPSLASRRVAPRTTLGLALLIAASAAAAGGATALATPGLAAAGTATEAPRAAPRLVDSLGVELTSVALSASGFMIDVRYRVVDAAKAQSLAERKVNPVLINQATGDRYYVPNAPKIGPLRQSATAKQPVLAGRVYFMLFANPDRRLRQGEKVILDAGDAIIPDIVVR